jgi:type II secretion system (T2SS) protein M
MNALFLAEVRRRWQVLVAALVFVLFMVAHALVFQPSVRSMRNTLESANRLGFALDPSRTPRMIPPRVLALLSNNALPENVAVERTESGALTAALLEEVSRLAAGNGMTITAAEPGPATQQPQAVLVRARLRMRCSFAEFVSFLDALSRTGTLISVDRFMLTGDGGSHDLDLSLTRYVLKQTGRRS